MLKNELPNIKFGNSNFLSNFRFLKYFITLFIVIFISFFLISHILLFFTPQKSSFEENKRYEIYLFHDLAHTEIVLKSNSLIKPLKEKLKPFIKDFSNYLAFSYGDQFFMLHIKRWKDMKFTTMLKALFINTPAVIKVGCYKSIKKDDSIIKIPVSKKTYIKLQNNILNSFKLKSGSLIAVKTDNKNLGLHYFRAYRDYNLFFTCNTYTGEILRESDLSVSLWTPLSYQVVYHFPK